MEDRFERNPAIESAPMKDETVLFNPENNKFCVLNRTAAFVWHTLDKPLTVGELATALVQRFDGVDRNQAERDVHSVIVELRKIECLAIREPSTTNDEGAQHE